MSAQDHAYHVSDRVPDAWDIESALEEFLFLRMTFFNVNVNLILKYFADQDQNVFEIVV